MNELDRMRCEQVFKRLDDYIDQELSPTEMELIREHLEICAWCARTFEFQIGILKELETRVQRIAVPAGLRNKVADALKRARTESST